MSSHASGAVARPARSLRRTLAAATLSLEGLVVLFAAIVAKDLSSLTPGQALGYGGALALACPVTAGLLRSPVGYGLGWLLQVLVPATGVWVPSMFFLGALFAVLWVTSWRVGGRIDREKAQTGPGQAVG